MRSWQLFTIICISQISCLCLSWHLHWQHTENQSALVASKYCLFWVLRQCTSYTVSLTVLIASQHLQQTCLKFLPIVLSLLSVHVYMYSWVNCMCTMSRNTGMSVSLRWHSGSRDTLVLINVVTGHLAISSWMGNVCEFQSHLHRFGI